MNYIEILCETDIVNTDASRLTCIFDRLKRHETNRIVKHGREHISKSFLCLINSLALSLVAAAKTVHLRLLHMPYNELTRRLPFARPVQRQLSIPSRLQQRRLSLANVRGILHTSNSPYSWAGLHGLLRSGLQPIATSGAALELDCVHHPFAITRPPRP